MTKRVAVVLVALALCVSAFGGIHFTPRPSAGGGGGGDATLGGTNVWTATNTFQQMVNADGGVTLTGGSAGSPSLAWQHVGFYQAYDGTLSLSSGTVTRMLFSANRADGGKSFRLDKTTMRVCFSDGSPDLTVGDVCFGSAAAGRLDITDESTGAGAAVTAASLQLAPQSLGSCTSAQAGTTKYVAGPPDSYSMCLQKTDTTYAWIAIVTAP